MLLKHGLAGLANKAAAGGLTFTGLVYNTVTYVIPSGASATHSITLTGSTASADRWLIVAVGVDKVAISDIDVDGNNIATPITAAAQADVDDTELSHWLINLATGTAFDVVLNYPTPAATGRTMISVYEFHGEPTLHSSASNTTSASSPVSLDLNTVNDSFVIANSIQGAAIDLGWTGAVTEDYEEQYNTSSYRFGGASGSITTGATPSSVGYTHSNPNERAAQALCLEAAGV